LFCSRCGADADAADAVFQVGALAHVVEADLPLLETSCQTCGTVTDVMLWPMEPGFVPRVLAEAGHAETREAEVVGRYAALVDGFERQAGAQHALWMEGEEFGVHFVTLDLGGIDLDRLLAPPLERPLAVPAAAFAAVRGARRAVERAAHPALHVKILVGQVTCVVSLDPGRVLHLSVSGVAGTAPSGIEQHLALALCFEPAERLRLTGQAGETVPVMHYFLWPSPAD
jgi:hypothetical protein